MTAPDGTAPGTEVLEVTTFGPGYGESAVLHLGQGQWGIIDSCYGVWSEDAPAALWYLEHIGVDPKAQVAFICATHWHDDHIAGMAKMVEACPSAKIYVSNAMRSDELLALARLYANSVLDGYGIKEFQLFLATCQKLTRPLKLVSQDVILESFLVGGKPGMVQALSPSSASVLRAIANLAKLVPEAGRPQLNLASKEPNHHSVVTLVSSEHTNALLGSDLEVTTDPETGWTALLQQSICFKDKLATFFKVSHHGSENGHSPELWDTRLMKPDPTVCVTPWCNGNLHLPTAKDVERIKALTSRAYITGHPRPKSAARTMPPLVRKELKERGLPLHFAPIACGYVRARWDTLRNDGWLVDCFQEAGKLEDVQLPATSTSA